VIAIVAIFILLFASAARASDIAVALTDDVIEVDAGFFGAHFVLFGAVTGTDDPEGHDIVAVVRGPPTTFRIRPMVRERAIWRAGPAIDIEGEPGLLLALATRPLADVAPAATLRDLGAAADPERIAASLAPRSDAAARHLESGGAQIVGAAFINDGLRTGRVRETSGAVRFRKGGLFSIDVALPPRTPVGAYSVETFLLRDGAVVARDNAALAVDKVGVERRIFELAHRRPFAYGLACVSIALAAGWLAAAAFRK